MRDNAGVTLFATVTQLIMQPQSQVNCLHSLSVTTMSKSGSYLVTLVALQPYSLTSVVLSYSGHGHADIPPLTTTIGLVSIRSLLHLPVYPVFVDIEFLCTLVVLMDTFFSDYFSSFLSWFIT